MWLFSCVVIVVVVFFCLFIDAQLDEFGVSVEISKKTQKN